MEMQTVARPPRFAPDYWLFHLTVLLVAIGILIVYDASYVHSIGLKRTGYDALYYLKRQALWATVGLFLMFWVMKCGYWRLRGWAYLLLGLSLVGLIAVFYMPSEMAVAKGAARWIKFGSVQFQPSEFAKLSLVIYLANVLSRKNYPIRDFWRGLCPQLFVVGGVALLVEREPDLGTAFVIGLVAITMFYAAGARKRHLLVIMICAGILVLLATKGHDYRWNRIRVLLNPEGDYHGAGYQIVHGLLAVGSGGPTGVGLGEGRGKYYLPESNTDFIFATIAEETGLWGSLLVLGLVMLLVRRGLCIALRAQDPFGMLLATGITAIIGWQSILNIAVVTNSLPATGVPLPFISYGGSSLMFLLIGVGILLNIAQNPEFPMRNRLHRRSA
jgi:cell division protein FtsW